MYSIHEAVDGAVVKPVAQAYVKYTPDPIRTGLSNFIGNIDDFFTGVNDFLQGNPSAPAMPSAACCSIRHSGSSAFSILLPIWA